MGRTIDLGKVMISFGGEWDPGIQYEFLTLVRYGHDSYLAKKDNIDVEPGTDADIWFPIASVQDIINYVEALGVRLDSAETTRIIAEGKRSDAEYQRQLAETSRKRSENERVSRESTRDTKENARISAENARAASELRRISAEEARVRSENSRIAQEESRQDNWRRYWQPLFDYYQAAMSGRDEVVSAVSSISNAVQQVSLFVAVKDETKVSEIVAARNMGRLVVCYVPFNGSSLTFTLSEIEGSEGGMRCTFLHTDSSGRANMKISCEQELMYVSGPNGGEREEVTWGNALFVPMPFFAEPAESINPVALRTDQAASTVAVYEFVQNSVSGLITNSVNDLTNYYLKSETYSRQEVNSMLNAIKQFGYEIAASLPTASEETMYKIFLTPSNNPLTQNARDEYITVRSGQEGSYTYAWEQIGSTSIDLSGKQDVIPDLETIRSGAAAGATAYQKPSGGIPDTDLSSAVRASLGKAETALQSHQDISGKVDKETGKALSSNDYTDIDKDALGRLKKLVVDALGSKYASNPVGPWRPDPCFWKADDGHFYVKGTGRLNTVLRTRNFVNFEDTGRTFISPDAEAWLFTNYGNYATDDASIELHPHQWAPFVIKIGNNWVMYIAVVERSGASDAVVDGAAHIVALTSRTPYGDFGNPVTIVSDNEVKAAANSSTKWNNVIDPFVYCDPDDGELYLVAGSSYAIRRAKLAPDGLSLAEGTFAQHVAGQSINTSPNRATVYEGAYLYPHIHNGQTYWYLFVSAGHYAQDDYCIKVGRSTKANGITSGTAVNYTDKNGTTMRSGGGETLLETGAGETFYGPGHIGGIIEDATGATYILYHCHDGSAAHDRKLMLQELLWDENGWPYVSTEGMPAERTTIPVVPIISGTPEILVPAQDADSLMSTTEFNNIFQ